MVDRWLTEGIDRRFHRHLPVDAFSTHVPFFVVLSIDFFKIIILIPAIHILVFCEKCTQFTEGESVHQVNNPCNKQVFFVVLKPMFILKYFLKCCFISQETLCDTFAHY